LSVGLACAASGYGLASFIKQSNGQSYHRGSESVAPEEQHLLSSNGRSAMMVDVVPPFEMRYFFVLVFLEAIALYGLIVALFLIGK
jgi:F0F1-type ATP synthase membrane subunit c/vacuolar-type H+-ATPase subunit K